MGLRIMTNTPSLVAQRNLSINTEANSQSMEKLSSGFRINKAADDAAGLAVSEKLKADIRGLSAAKRNASDGVSLVQTAEGGLNEVGNILIRLRELAVQAASDTIGGTEREFLNKEFGQLKEEVTRITRTVEFNGTPLLMGDLDNAPDALKTKSNQYPLEIQVGKNFMAELDGQGTSQPVNIIRLDLTSINATVGEGGLNLGETAEEGAHVLTRESAQGSLSTLDDALTKVSGYRSMLGSIQSRLGSTISNLSIQTENMTAANSRIRDTDFAEESARLTQSNILKQAGISVLSNANQNPSAALRLLG